MWRPCVCHVHNIDYGSPFLSGLLYVRAVRESGGGAHAWARAGFVWARVGSGGLVWACVSVFCPWQFSFYLLFFSLANLLLR